MEKVGVVSGKFRIFHKGHKDVILKATQYDIDKLAIIIHDQKSVKRYSSLEDLILCIKDVLKDCDIKYEIIVTRDDYSDFENWEEFILKTFDGDDILMFNSKENYKNIKLKNTYINCDVDINMSASDIEINPFCHKSNNEIADEFKPFFKNRLNLFINTSYSQIDLFVFNEKYSKLYSINSINDHSKKLYLLYKEMIDKEGELFDKIYIINGPGSYTGLRVGVIFAKTIASEREIPIVPINLLDVIYKTNNKNVALDARGGKYFCFDGKEFSIKEDIENYNLDLAINYNNLINYLEKQKEQVVKEIKINYLKEVL